jgi:phosphoglucomutase
MKNFREQAPLDFAGLSVEKMLDYNQGIGTLPLANVVEFDLEGGAKVIVRPSGTEPKIKVYLFTTGASSKQAVALGDTLAQALSPSFQ